jgi:hypothetical protein
MHLLVCHCNCCTTCAHISDLSTARIQSRCTTLPISRCHPSLQGALMPLERLQTPRDIIITTHQTISSSLMRKHNPVSFFAAQAWKVVPKLSSNHASVSSVSSYARSVVSSISCSCLLPLMDCPQPHSSIFDHKPHDRSKTNAFSNQLKKLYRDISHLVPHSLLIRVNPRMRVA